MGLTLTRREGEELELTFSENMSVAELEALLRDGITIAVRRIHEQHGSLQTKLHITAPRSVNIRRTELPAHD